MSSDEIHRLYTEKVIDHGLVVSNGPWILRPFLDAGVHQPNCFPEDLSPYRVWRMVQQKIASSSAVVALVDPKAYGTIAEISYAAGLGTVGVYVLPAPDITYEDRADLWLSFQLSLETSRLWMEEDITNVDLFGERNIHSLADYRRFVEAIVPKFLRRES